jgi:hypothetical protein
MTPSKPDSLTEKQGGGRPSGGRTVDSPEMVTFGEYECAPAGRSSPL